MDVIAFVMYAMLCCLLVYWILENLKTEKRKKLLYNLQIEKLCRELSDVDSNFNLNDYIEH